MESYQGGFSSSALATRRGLALDQSYGVHLTDKRLIVTKEKSHMGLGWNMNAGSLFGSFTAKVTPFLDTTPRTVEQLDNSNKKLDVSVDQILLVELKPPRFLSKGHITIDLKSGKSYKLLLLNSVEEHATESFATAEELFQKHLPGVLKVV
ncbi:MAG: hypothetical protein ABSG57_10245 [Candidatus Bathyarchaeia archaeon]